MIRENPKFLFSSKKGYIFIKSGRKWLKRHDNESRTSYISSLISPFNRSVRSVFNAFPLGFLIPAVSHRNQLWRK